VLFCDIRDFTRLSGTLDAREIVDLLNDVLARLVDVVFEHGGTLDKFLGDGLMAVFGAPLSSGRDEEMAVRAAVRMQEEVDRFNGERKARDLAPIRVGIGVHSGDVVAGSIGSLRRLEYTVIGRTVNLASRIEQLNKQLHTDILISAATYDRVRHLVDVESEPVAEVKGVTEGVVTYRLLAVRDIPDSRVGEEFVRMGAMTDDQVGRVLEVQKRDPRFFGEIAVEMGFVSEESLAMFLAAVKSPREPSADCYPPQR
jgi:adenylate cyclase